jgi:pantoate--beta-alanine ligase
MPRFDIPRLYVAETVPSLRAHVAGWRAAGETIAIVPTMGALHAGHLALVARARREAQRVVVSIFVNPTQFGPSEDFGTYPRTFEADCAALSEAKADLVYAPNAKDMYPDGFSTQVSLTGPASAGLEDRFRPTHFAGVATVVAKLFTRVMPDVAVFGQKDYQQLQVVTRMAADLDLGVRVIGEETLREADGLAMSSRNRYLSPDERAMASILNAALLDCAKSIRSGISVSQALDHASSLISTNSFKLDYLEARHAATLAPVTALSDGPMRLLVAAKLGTTRLIDNIAV